MQVSSCWRFALISVSTVLRLFCRLISTAVHVGMSFFGSSESALDTFSVAFSPFDCRLWWSFRLAVFSDTCNSATYPKVAKKFSVAATFIGLNNVEGKALAENQDTICRWREYVEELYGDSSRTMEPLIFDGELTKNERLGRELDSTTQWMKKGKAAGPDYVNTEMYLLLLLER